MSKIIFHTGKADGTRAENSFVHVLTPESSDLTKIVKTTFNNILTLMFQMKTNLFLSFNFMKPDKVGNIIWSI